jgi:hypothetical protein
LPANFWTQVTQKIHITLIALVQLEPTGEHASLLGIMTSNPEELKVVKIPPVTH